MKQFLLSICLLLQTSLFAQAPPEKYPVDSASVEHAGVPRGEILKFTFDQSKFFLAPGGNIGCTCQPNINPINLPVYM